jgi:molybdenum cofactor cytidylyltransferase
MKTGAVVVAAGLSSRMKSFKPMLPLVGSTMIKTAISTLESAGVTTIVVVTGNNAEALGKHLADVDAECINNESYASTDMYYSACMGLNHIRDKVGRVFFLPCDVPLFSRQSLVAMMEYMDQSSCSILLPAHNGKKGHPVLIKNDAIPQIVSHRGGGGLRGAIEAFSGVKDVIDLPDAGITMDADNPEDYKLLQSYANSIRKST